MEQGDFMKIEIPKIKRIRLRMTLYFTVLVILVILIINYFTSLIFSGELVRQNDFVVQRKLETIISDMHEKLAIVRSMSFELQQDKNITSLLLQDESQLRYGRTDEEKIRISQLFQDYAARSKLINKIILIDKNENILDLEYANKEFKELVLKDEQYLAFSYSSFMEDYSMSELFPTNKNKYINRNEHYVNYLNKFMDTNYNRLGILIVGINTDVLFEYTEVFCREVFDFAFIVNSKDELIMNVGTVDFEDYLVGISHGRNEISTNKLKTIKGEKYLIFNKPLSYNTDWRIIGAVSYNRLTQNVKLMRLTIYIIGILCIFMVIIVSFNIAKKITEPIIRVNKAILRLDKGEWPKPVEVNSEDELKHLVVGFNRMVKNLQTLFEKIYEEEESKKKAEIKALKFQLELLQSQINPHFIYNTLNTFSYFALKNGDEKLRELIQSFNSLLRASISVESNFVTIEKELDLTDKYLKIQESRYGGIFQVVYLVPGELLQYKIPMLILQPLVENAIFHGIAPRGTNGTITIEFVLKESCIKIKVIDNGVGMEEKDICEILRGKRNKESKGFNNIGITNIKERLKLYFGDDYDLYIHSSLGEGTTVEFCIPLVGSI
jgi:two-component system, sensor histidine kinase YesM